MNDPHNASTTPAHRCFPLSLGQQALWVLYREAPHSTAYHMALPLRFAAPVQTATLARAIDRLAARHGMLRARFGEADGVPYQWSEPECGPQLRLHASLPDTPTLEAALRTALAAPFVLEDGCFRADWFAPAAADAGGGVLLLTLHHLAGDAGSLAVLGRELPALYAAERDGTPPDLPPLPADYPDYVRWETDLLAGPDGARMGAYWQQRLAGAPPVLQLPGDRPRPPRQSFDGGSIDFTLPPPLAAGLRALAGRERATLPSLLLGAFAALLHRSSGQTHLRIGVPTALVRTRPAFAGLVGYLVNPLVFESRLDESAPTAFRTLLAATTRQLFDGLRHQPYPFPLLVERLAPARDPSRSPLIQALFAYEDDQLLPRHFAAAGVSAERLYLPQMEGQFDLTLTLVDAGSLDGRLSYDRALFDADTVRRMVGHLECLLVGIVADPAADVRTLALCGAADFPADRTLVDPCEAQVQGRPDAIAQVGETAWQDHRSDDGDTAFPLSAAQREIWFAEQRLGAANPTYRVGDYIVIPSAVDPARFETALRRAVAEAQPLRVRFVEGRDGPCQVLKDFLDWPLPVIDFTTQPDPSATAQAWMAAQLAQPMDLGRGPLFSYALLKIGAGLFYWLQHYHHIVLDGFGHALFARRVAELYTAVAQGGTATSADSVHCASCWTAIRPTASRSSSRRTGRIGSSASPMRRNR